jgi:threonine/homoserine/homoserine lactone efflux protein
MLTSFLFGITIAIAVGPITLLIVNNSINCGISNGIRSGAAAATADFTYALVAFLAGTSLIGIDKNLIFKGF